MLHLFHSFIVDDSKSTARLEYGGIALFIVLSLHIAACVATRNGRATRVFDAAAGASVALACLITLLLRGLYFPRQVISTVLMMAWGARLSVFLWRRVPPSEATRAERAPVLTRVAWATACALPCVVCNTQQRHIYRSTLVELTSLCAATAALFIEHAADSQKAAWFLKHSERPGKSDMEPPVCADGLWAYSRHPNLFSELMFHWSIFCIVHPVESWFIIFCPLYITLCILILPGGVATQEMSRNKKYALYPSYQRYKNATPPLFPAPGLYSFLGSVAPTARRVLCCNPPLYDELF